jgi:hypothetical protein
VDKRCSDTLRCVGVSGGWQWTAEVIIKDDFGGNRLKEGGGWQLAFADNKMHVNSRTG